MLDPVEFGKAMAVIVRERTAHLEKRIEQLEARQPERGEPGPPGRDAEPIEAKAIVAELLAGPEIKTLVDFHVAEHFEAHPVQNGKDGEHGKDGERGAPGQAGEKGEPGVVGKDGAGIADLFIDRDGALVATMTDGRTKSLGVVVGKDGERGKDGSDFSDATIEYDGERTLIIRGKGGEIVKRMPIPMDKGYWRDGMEAEKADIVTHNGNAWIALRDTKAKPCVENKEDWRLFARKGRDGNDSPPRAPVAAKPVTLK